VRATTVAILTHSKIDGFFVALELEPSAVEGRNFPGYPIAIGQRNDVCLAAAYAALDRQADKRPNLVLDLDVACRPSSPGAWQGALGTYEAFNFAPASSTASASSSCFFATSLQTGPLL
jgi:hypothetical protein